MQSINSMTKKKRKSSTNSSMELKKSLWHSFNPSISQALEKVCSLIEMSKHDKFILGIMHLENLASIIFSYGDEICIAKTKQLQPIIKKIFGRHCKTIRISIDEFMYFCPYTEEKDYIKNVEILANEVKRFGASIPGTPIFFSFKIGAAHMDRSTPIRETLDKAFIALYECRKIDTVNHCLFSQISDKMLEYKKQMEMAVFFQKVINDNRMQMAWQPVVNSKTGQIKNYEALLRIVMDDGSIFSAGPYVSIAEMYGYVTDVDKYVLRTVVHELKTNSIIQVGMNISTLTIDDASWLFEARGLLRDPDVAKRLIIEITETGIQRHIQKTISFVESVQAMGCQVAIDDFGAGYTSFSQLKMLNVDILKIDGIFIKDLHVNTSSQLFVKTLMEFAKAFGIKTVAEFVENGEIAKILIELGVDYLQGYYFDKPLNHRPWITKDC